MSLITIKEFAKQAGISSVIVMKRIHAGEIEATVDTSSGRLRRVIDDKKFKPKDHKPRKPGRPNKK